MDFDQIDDATIDLESLGERHRLGRRTFLIGALATGAAVAGPVNYAAIARKRKIPIAKKGVFDLGVASGVPRPRGTTLWTRLGGIGRTSRLTVQVAKDPKFKKVVVNKKVTARADRDFTARTWIKGLRPDRRYYYRFLTKNKKSPVGRFRTTPPPDSNAPIRIAFYSCQSYEAGFYNVQRAIANEPDLHLVLCLGDYVYESHYFDGPAARRDTTGDNRDGHVEFLREWRQKYRLYKGDPDLQAMHAAHPFAATWDDHEAEDNYAGDDPSSAAPAGQSNNDHPRRLSFAERRAAGYQAFFNYMPRIRFKGDRDRIFEELRLGGLVNILLTDERQYRDQQPCNDAIVTPCLDEQGNRTMLGQRQKDWFKAALRDSPQPWKLWGNELMVMGFQSAPEIGLNNDAWDGYAKERKELLTYMLGNGIKNVVSLTGDIHTFFTGTATTTGSPTTGQPVLAEFVGGSATSAGISEETGIPASVIQTALPLFNPHITFTDLEHKGYGLVEVTPTQLTCEYKAVPTIGSRNGGQTFSLGKWRVPLGAHTPERIA
jgi:alkaline phosphatase D